MLIPSALADLIRSNMGFPLPVSAQLIGWATAVISEITANGKVNNASGTITGTCPAIGGPLLSGAGTNGIISGLSASRLAASIASQANYPFTSAQLIKFSTQIVNHIQGSGVVTFTTGNITGSCTNTPVSPGSLTAGAGAAGLISGLSGPTLASAIHSDIGYPGSVSGPLIQFCTSFTSYIMGNAQVSYTSGNITGSCPTSGGALTSGSGINGTVA